MTTWNINTPPDETRDALALAEHRLAAHAVAWVTAAERLGLEIREEEPEETMRRVLDAILQRQTEHAHRSVAWREMGAEAMQHRAREREAVVAWLRAEATYLRGPGVYAHDLADLGDLLADAIERGEHVGEGR